MSSDAASSAYRIQHLTGEDNIQTWTVKMTDILTDMGLHGYPSGTIPKPALPDSDATVIAWSEKDRRALSAIRLRVADGPLIYITDAKTSQAAWDTLMATYQSKGVIGIVLLRRKLSRTTCADGADIEDHIRTLTSIRTQLSALGSQVEDKEFCIILLTSLPDSWDSFIRGVDTSALTTPAPLIARILEQQHQMTSRSEANEVALAVRNRFQGKGKNSKAKYNGNISCFGCGRPGHVIADCRDTKAGKTFTKEQKERNARGDGGKSGKNPSWAHVSQDQGNNSETSGWQIAALLNT
ncbi:unnamed protein product [Mycena citricolor]|uniref:CCHC-type domain-containing protein n=1 Tax=Mycena citricolor TaxID=2018698 RepID=A0AAD2K8G4_9AGAR|nr:unnamed protein product [Mycena citricolor]